jgi:hypothetical protein
MGLSREAILFGLIMFLISAFGSLKSQMLEKSSGLEAFGGLQKAYAPVIWEGSANQKNAAGTKAELQARLDSYAKAIDSYKKRGLLKRCAIAQTEFAWAQFLRVQTCSIQERDDFLARAETALREALTFFTPESMPKEWAEARSKLGNVFQAQAAFSNLDQDKRRLLLKEASTAYEEARAAYKSIGSMEYADMAQMEFASALQDEAAIATDPTEASELADKACGIYQEILRKLKSGKDHWLRKSAENNLANIIYFRARLFDNTAKVEMLQMAIDTYRAILKKQSRTTDVELYAYNQVNLAAALREQAISGESSLKRERLMEALKCFTLALEVFTPESFPQRAARAQIGLGLTQFELSQDETLSQNKRDWFFKKSLMNLFEGTTQRNQDAEFIKNGREAIKMLQEVTIPEPK